MFSLPASRLPARARRIAAHGSPPAFGVLADVMRDNVYRFAARGFLYTSPWVVSRSTERQSAVVLLSASGRDFELHAGGAVVRCAAAAVGPLVRRGLCAVDVGLVSVNVQPDHPAFPAFCGIGAPGIARLERRDFARFDADLLRAYEGRLSHRDSERLFEDLVAEAVARLLGDPRGGGTPRRLHALLRGHADGSLAEIARLLDVSYSTASHLFSREVGLPFRTYRHWVKCIRAAEQFGGELSLTQIAQLAGFSDSAHLSRTWKRRYGLPPSHVRDPSRVRVME